MDDKYVAAIWLGLFASVAALLITISLSYNNLRLVREGRMADVIRQGGHPALVGCAFTGDCRPETVMAIVAEIERRRP